MLDKTSILNQIPVNTWSWLGVNATQLRTDMPIVTEYVLEDKPVVKEKGLSVIDIKEAQEKLKDLPVMQDAGVSQDMTKFVINNCNSGYYIEVDKNKRISEPIILHYVLDGKNDVLVDNTVIVARSGSEVTVVIDYVSTDGVGCFHSGLTRIYAEAEAKVHLVKAQILPDDALHIDAVSSNVAQKAQVRTTLIELGSVRTITSSKMQLLEQQSEGFIDSLYFGDKDREIDINYLLTHKGVASNGEIDLRGVLLDESKKVFRGTLDFKRGASGSVGSEEEYTVILSPNIRSRSVPILLCGEDDVQGQHAASTGKLDEDKIFYLMSRGLSELEAKKLIVEASLRPVLDKIPVESLQKTVAEYIRRRIEYV